MAIYEDQEGIIDLISYGFKVFIIMIDIIQKVIFDLKFRFDYEIELPVPNELQRKDILTKQLSHIEQEISEDEIISIAHRAQGFVGADLLAVVNRAQTEASINNENVTIAMTSRTAVQIATSLFAELLLLSFEFFIIEPLRPLITPSAFLSALSIESVTAQTRTEASRITTHRMIS